MNNNQIRVNDDLGMSRWWLTHECDLTQIAAQF